MNNNQANQQVSQPKVEVVEAKKPDVVKDGGPENKNKMIGLAVLIIIVLGIIFLSGGKKTEDQTENLVSTVEGCAEGDIFSTTTGEPCSPTSATESPTALDPAVSLNTIPSNYDNALVEYASKSILFDASCVPTPKMLEIRVGTRVLIANNSTDKILKIKVLDRTEDLSPLHYMLNYGFGTVGEYPVSCGGYVSATINVK